MEKMNQVSVSEFMNLTKTQMYDKAVEMVEKYNRLVDICNDSAERISELVIERNDLVEKHNTYTHSLNADIAAKDAKIELMQKELDGRKAGYVALKAQMDTKYISIEEHNDICKTYEINNESLKNQVEYLKEELWKRIEGLKRANRIAVNSVYGIASASIREEDDHGRAGFKKYIEWLIEEEERAVPERFKARLNEEITEIFEKEEETEVKDIPCGEDSIE